MTWQYDLQPASWRRVPFYVEMTALVAGRNTAVHAFPFRTKEPAWPEDLGLAPSVIQVTGFLIGDDVRQQVLAMYGAMKLPGQGELVHPVYGSQTGSIIGECRYIHRKERGRYCELSFAFLAFKRDAPYPEAKKDTQADVKKAAPVGQSAAATSYLKTTGSTTPSALADAPGPGHA